MVAVAVAVVGAVGVGVGVGVVVGVGVGVVVVVVVGVVVVVVVVVVVGVGVVVGVVVVVGKGQQMLAAIDCDLRELTAVFSDGQAAQCRWPAFDALLGLFRACDTLLYEIASAVDYTDSKAVAHNKRRWTIFNAAMAMRINDACQGSRFLVSPSHVWTKGYPEKVRHKLAGCTQRNHDLREAECMLWMYRQDPSAWVPLHQFLEKL